MKRFVAKRLAISILILLAGSLLMFVLVINSGDPLQDLRESTDPNRDNLIAQRTAYMGLDLPWYVRYWNWLRGVGGCLVGRCSFGVTSTGQKVTSLLGQAAATTLRLVIMAMVLAIVIGIFFGIMTAIRQYSGFDYIITFIAFVLYSLPSFVFAILLKEYGAIRFNNWLTNPTISLITSLITAALVGALLQAMFASNRRSRLTIFVITLVVVFAVMQFLSLTHWAADPAGSWILPIITTFAAAVLFTMLLTGIHNRQVLVTTTAVGILTLIVMIAVSSLLWKPNWLLLVGLLVGMMIVAGVLGYFGGGYAKRASLWASVWTAFSVVLSTYFTYLLASWSDYLYLLDGKAISTIGSQTPNFSAANFFWLDLLDKFAHLALPTISLTLLSLAGYIRYTRASMLEVLSQDYVRTARAKGLPERMVVTRHAFRNAMIPILTILAFDFAGLLGGTLITETVFGWKGMGLLFKDGLAHIDPAPVMAYFLVTATSAVVMNMVADILYATIDPRIRR